MEQTQTLFNLATGQVEDYQPPAPADDELRTWAWHADTKRWVASPTDAAVAIDVRARRDALLTECDWVTVRALELGEEVPADWAAYRAALRDIPEQPGFPRSVTWPEPPTWLSHALYATRLYWVGPRGGIAKLHGRRVDLHAPPHFAGAPVVGVDYVPEIGLRQIQHVAEPWRDMTDDEVRQADATLRAVVTPAGWKCAGESSQHEAFGAPGALQVV